jgi:hypothetical protein
MFHDDLKIKILAIAAKQAALAIAKIIRMVSKIPFSFQETIKL